MKTKTRFIKGIVASSDKDEVVLPWTRGARRAAFIAKRSEATKVRKSA